MCSSDLFPSHDKGSQWDTELKTMDDLHKPALDGIGYQDSINSERAWWAGYYNADPDKKETAAGKTVAWINYMTNVNRTYRDWLETVFTGGEYMERCETPVFEGGTSQEIVFQEVISNSATEQEPLGTLAGRGITTNKQRGGHIKIKVTEPGYIMCICSITPRIDYSRGNQWDTELKTMDDLHKPALDGIGYRDSINSERAWWAG